jgi:hypothetical protein
MKKQLGLAAVLGVGLSVALATPAAAGAGTIYVPDDFVQELSGTRANGSFEVEGSGLRIRTTPGTGTPDPRKVAEYVATKTALADAGEPNLDYTPTSGAVPGFQLVVDFDNNDSVDGILIGEEVYNGDWWLNNAAEQFVKDSAPSHTGGYGSANHGTLDEWREEFPTAQVTAFGFSLGSGPVGEGVINAIEFAGTRYTFAEHVTLKAKDQCKNGGWETSTKPVFKNQGACVSSFATAKSAGKALAK